MIQIKNLSFSYSKNNVFRDLSLDGAELGVKIGNQGRQSDVHDASVDRRQEDAHGDGRQDVPLAAVIDRLLFCWVWDSDGFLQVLPERKAGGEESPAAGRCG